MAYIERESAIKSLLNDCLGQVSYSREDAADCISYMDAADVAPVRHGRWVQCKYADKSAKCSECGGYYTRFTVNERYPKYCLHCGTKMDLEG